LKNEKIKFITKVGMLSAIAVILQYLGTVIGLRIGGFLDVELSDYPAIIATLAIGPAAGVLTELIKNLIHLTMSTTGFVGELANFIINGVFVLTAGIIYKRNKTKKGAYKALSAATLALCAAGILANLFIMLPLYMPGAPLSERMNIVITLITPFNLVRGAAISALTLLTYKGLSPILHK